MNTAVARRTAPATIADIDARLARLEELFDRAPALLATLTDTVDELCARLARTGAPIDQRTEGMLVLAEQLTRPETSTALARTAARLDEIEGAIAALAEVPATFAALTDVIDEFADRLAEQGVELDQLGRRAGDAAQIVAAMLSSADLEDGPSKVGLFGLLRARRDPDIQRAIALFVRFSRALGKAIASTSFDSTKELPSG